MTIIFLCASTLWINLTMEPWNSHDKKVYERALHVCSTDRRYRDTPCVRSFTKVETQTYRVICGATTENHRNMKY